MEQEAEKQRLIERRKKRSQAQVEKTGEAILDLVITEQDRGLGDRVLCTLVKRNRELALPWTRLKVGSPIVLSSEKEGANSANQGVISRKSNRSMQVALANVPEGDRFRIDLASNDITHQRHLAAVKRVKSATGRLGRLREITMGEREPQFQNLKSKIDFQTDLNESQKSAVRLGLSAKDLAIIHGPPGTGKTTTVVEFIVQSILRGDRVLACAPSNTAVDNLVEKLVGLKQRVVRVGHSARITERLRSCSLDSLVEQHENMSVIREMQREIDSLYRQAERFTRAKPAFGQKRGLRDEAKRLRSYVKLLEQQAVDHILGNADCICGTTTFDENLIRDLRFDVCVIDEACQSVEPGCWLPIAFADRFVLSGDHCQLPPTVVSTEAAREGFDLSLMERVTRLLPSGCTQLLDVQYRMHDQIMAFSSKCFYENRLVGHSTVSSHLLSDFDLVDKTDLTHSPIGFIDTAGADWSEELEPEGESKRNPEEARLVIHFCNQLIECGVPQEDIAVIVPYAAQTRFIKSINPNPDVEIDTVDGFQGREKEAVILSMVRSNANGEIGFLKDERRMNVAMTRAKRKLIIIGDSATLSKHDFFKELVEYFESKGAYQSVWEIGVMDD